MKKMTSLFTAAMITGLTLMSLQTASAQEWRVLLDKNIFTSEQMSHDGEKRSEEEIDWLATQTPLLPNRPFTGDTKNDPPLRKPIFQSEYSQIGSWAPLQSDPGKENFTLFAF